ncbi:Uncharacterized protein BM_BM832 [Brugia malayi]|uniref:MSP domain-containing protein n=1 Tax=Brugia malayi TaxID=6279 RepID=A0A4E9FF41_BRUMA|nr:Uncharacterized protein BM_BM832 [Brugia malayi]VIO94946.1 Uncharacterized protein BM_BM832 [Brugia malayi]
MSECGAIESFGMDEFPKIPQNYTGFHVLPSVITLKLNDSSTITLRNSSNFPVLYKDRFLIIYTLVGMQWCINDANALLCWQRAKAQQIPTKTIILNAKLK